MSGLRTRDERGVVFPSPVVMLSIIAIAMAGIAYVATQGQEPTEREITTTVAQPSAKPKPTPTASPTLAAQEPKKIKKRKPAVQRGEVYVEVYNNSGITGLAGTGRRERLLLRVAGRRLRQLVRHDPRLDRLLPAAGSRTRRRCWPSTSAWTGLRPRWTRCGPTA